MSDGGLSVGITNALAKEAQRIYKGLDDVSKKISADALKEIKVKSPIRTGDYKKGWRKKKVDRGYVIYNQNYRLPHLVERDTKNRAGRITQGKPHIQPVEEKAIREMESAIIELIERGD